MYLISCFVHNKSYLDQSFTSQYPVRFLVTPQVPWSTEGLHTMVARVGLVFHMSHPVVVQVGASSKALATGITLVWFLSCVDSSVSVQGGTCRECFLTELTGVGPFPGVSSHMSLQQAWSVKHLATLVAWKYLLGEAKCLPLLLLLYSWLHDCELILTRTSIT